MGVVVERGDWGSFSVIHAADLASEAPSRYFSTWDLEIAELPCFEIMEIPLSLLYEKFMLSACFCLVLASLKKFLLVDIELMLSS